MSKFCLLICCFWYVCLVSCNPVSKEKSSAPYKRSKKGSDFRNSITTIITIDSNKYSEGVREYVDSINGKLSGFKRQSTDVFGSSSEGGEIKVYSFAGDTAKIEGVYYGETGKVCYDIYLKNNELVSFLETSTYYHTLMRPKEIDSVVSAHFIIRNGQIVSGEKGGDNVDKGEFSHHLGQINEIYKQIMQELFDDLKTKKI